jgi:hypothetical protein
MERNVKPQPTMADLEAAISAAQGLDAKFSAARAHYFRVDAQHSMYSDEYRRAVTARQDARDAAQEAWDRAAELAVIIYRNG